MADDIEKKLAALQAEVDEQFAEVEKSTEAMKEDREEKVRKAKKDLGKELGDLGEELKKKALVKAAKGQVGKLNSKKTIIGLVAIALLILFILKNIWLILFGAAGLAGLWYLLSQWMDEGEEEDEEADDE